MGDLLKLTEHEAKAAAFYEALLRSHLSGSLHALAALENLLSILQEPLKTTRQGRESFSIEEDEPEEPKPVPAAPEDTPPGPPAGSHSRQPREDWRECREEVEAMVRDLHVKHKMDPVSIVRVVGARFWVSGLTQSVVKDILARVKLAEPPAPSPASPTVPAKPEEPWRVEKPQVAQPTGPVKFMSAADLAKAGRIQ